MTEMHHGADTAVTAKSTVKSIKTRPPTNANEDEGV